LIISFFKWSLPIIVIYLMKIKQMAQSRSKYKYVTNKAWKFTQTPWLLFFTRSCAPDTPNQTRPLHTLSYYESRRRDIFEGELWGEFKTSNRIAGLTQGEGSIHKYIHFDKTLICDLHKHELWVDSASAWLFVICEHDFLW
jgi:hypothetical protein